MNRAELSWALSAVLPHAGKGQVGIEQRGESLYVYALDGYTLGIASVAYPDVPVANGYARHLLSAKEAAELERWVRPGRVAQREQGVAYTATHDELHIATTDGESTVFAAERGSHLDKLLELVQHAKAAKTEWAPVAVNPHFIARFGKAGESVRLDFKRYGAKGGAFLVHAPNFVGVARNIGYDWTPEENFEIPLAS